MRKFLSILSALLKKAAEMLENNENKAVDIHGFSQKTLEEVIEPGSQSTFPVKENISDVISNNNVPLPKLIESAKKEVQKKKKEAIIYKDKTIRDVIDLMEFPFVALSKDRVNPIIYESPDKTQKVVISGHRGHFIASIYDWDIILVVAGKIQEILNKGSDIPSNKITIPRHELLKALHRQGGRKEQKNLEKSLDRLQLTGISTTINNKDFRHRAGFGFVDSWSYSERKNDRETRQIQITLSPWLYELCCSQGSLLKSNRLYFDITSGLKKFLYRTARKHAGEDEWEFSLEKLYEKSGSEGNIRKFKSKIKMAVIDNDLPDYSMELIEREGKVIIFFKKRSKIDELDRIIEKYDEKPSKLIGSNMKFNAK